MLLIKIKQQDLLPDSENISDSNAYLRDYMYMICLIFPRTERKNSDWSIVAGKPPLIDQSQGYKT